MTFDGVVSVSNLKNLNNPILEETDKYSLLQGDMLNVLPTLQEASIDTCISDPPYGLKFMGENWDHGVPGKIYWQAVLRVLKPGAFLLAFGGTRTYHRLVCAIEDAGFEIRDCIMWQYGSGFPKSHPLGKAIAAHKSTGKSDSKQISDGTARDRMGQHWSEFPKAKSKGNSSDPVPVDPEWEGWGTALKPSYEPCVVAMKPLEGTYADNALTHGVAGINIDGCRVQSGGDTLERPAGLTALGQGSGWNSCNTKEMITGDSSKGRWPTNTIMSHHPECVCVGITSVKKSRNSSTKYQSVMPDDTEQVEDWKCHENCPMKILDDQSGTLRARGNITATKEGKSTWFGAGKGTDDGRIDGGDTGGASRFFYHAKVSQKERTHAGRVTNKHPTVKPIDLMRYLCRLTATPTKGIVLDPFMGSGSTGLAALLENRRFIGIEKEDESFQTATERLKDVENYKEDFVNVQEGSETVSSKKETKPLFVQLFATEDEDN